MTTEQLFISGWNWSPWVIAVCAGALWFYHRSEGSWSRLRAGWLCAGLAVFFLTMCSPLDGLANGFLFSAHMLQHLLLLLIVPLLILASLPEGWPGSRQQPMNWILQQPLLTWSLGVGGMWLWHAPMLCNAAVSNPWVHRLQYVSLLLMGFAFWWPVFGPRARQRLAPLAGMLYLFSGCVGCTVLGIIITFSPVEVCPVFLHPVDGQGILPLIQNQWGLTAARDQQLGGLLMWVPACLLYFSCILNLLARWYREPGRPALAPAPVSGPLLEKPYGS